MLNKPIRNCTPEEIVTILTRKQKNYIKTSSKEWKSSSSIRRNAKVFTNDRLFRIDMLIELYEFGRVYPYRQRLSEKGLAVKDLILKS